MEKGFREVVVDLEVGGLLEALSEYPKIIKKWDKHRMRWFRSCEIGEVGKVNESGIKDGCREGRWKCRSKKGCGFCFFYWLCYADRGYLEWLAFTVGLVTTGKCSLERLEGGPKVKIYIGNPASHEDSQSGSRPQDVVALDNERNGKFNFARMTY